MSARHLVVDALIEWDQKRPHADELLHDFLDHSVLSPRDRAFATEVFYGILRRLTELDFLISRFREGPLDPETRAVLQLGFYQLRHMRVPTHAAVFETVALSRRAGGLVNAILRRALREGPELDAALDRAPLEVRTSHPAFLLEKWTQDWGADAVARLTDWNLSPAQVTLRANTLKITPEALLARIPGARPHPFHPLAIEVEDIPHDLLAAGLAYVQDPSTLVSCDLLAPQRGETVLDACAAPGGKTTLLAAMMENTGRIVACDLWESRVTRLRENLRRLGVTNTAALPLDTMKPHAELAPASFDRILIDAPCSNTGVIRRRVDVKWRLTDEDFLRMPAQQMALVRRCTELLKPGGTLVYSTCSLEPEENTQLCERIARELPALIPGATRTVQPWVDGVDGAFAASFTRAE